MSEYPYPSRGTCDGCAEGTVDVRLEDPNDGNSAYICRQCDERFARCVVAAVEHIKGVQETCGTKLCQVDRAIDSSDHFGPIVDVDVDYLVRDVLAAYFKADHHHAGQSTRGPSQPSTPSDRDVT